MDIIEILFPIVAAVLYFYFASKKKSGKTVPPPVQTYEFEDEDYSYDEQPNYAYPTDVLEKIEQNYPKKERIVNYDELTQENWQDEISRKETPLNTSYSFDNEEENGSDIFRELEDVRRGIIYAEILKSPCS